MPPPRSQRAPLLINNANSTHHNNDNTIDFTNVPSNKRSSNSINISSCAGKSTANAMDTDSTPLPPVTLGEQEHCLRQLVRYKGDKYPENVLIKKTLLKSKTV